MATASRRTEMNRSSASQIVQDAAHSEVSELVTLASLNFKVPQELSHKLKITSSQRHMPGAFAPTSTLDRLYRHA